MRHLTFVLLISGMITLTPQSSSANSEQELPTEAEIRSYYSQVSPEWEELPRIVLLAFVAAEDRLFFENKLKKSMVTRSLAKRFISSAADVQARESELSEVLSSSLSYDEILNWYVNGVYLGLNCYGAATAARAYFDRDVGGIQLAEAAYLAALPIAPASLHPVKEHERAIERRNFVLSEMRLAGFISEKEQRMSSNSNLAVRVPLKECARPAGNRPRWMRRNP